MTIRGLMNATAICAVLAGGSLSVLAEDNVTPLTKQPAAPAGGAATATHPSRPILAGKLIGTTVRDPVDQKLGTINDLLIAPDRRVDQYVLSVGGVLGVGDKLVAMPVASFTAGSDGLILRGTTQESLKLLPDFNKTAFTEVAGGKNEANGTTHIAPATLASAMIGSSVRDTTDQKIGAVNDMVIGPDRKVEQFVVSVGGFLGLGDKLVALPVTDFRAHKDGLVLAGVSRESLEASPAFDKAVFAAASPAPMPPAPTSDMDRLKADYQAKMQEWSRKVSEYRDKAATGADETKVKVQQGLDSAWERAKAQWSEFKDATAETYGAAKTRLDRAIQDLDRSWQETAG